METRLDANCLAGHTLFYKEHEVRNALANDVTPGKRTLIVLNVPPYYDEVWIIVVILLNDLLIIPCVTPTRNQSRDYSAQLEKLKELYFKKNLVDQRNHKLLNHSLLLKSL